MPSLTKSFPVWPCVWKARFSMVLLLARRADFSRRWQATLTSMPDRMSMMVARTTPHCLKQKGMAKMLTPGKKI